MRTTADAIRSMPRSGIREIFDRANRLPDAIHLEMGEPNFPTPQHISDAAAAAVSAGFTKYTPNAGFIELREAVAKKLLRANGIVADADQVAISAGGISGLFSTMVALCNPGEEVLTFGPAWPNYRMIATLLGLTLVQVPGSGVGVDLEALEAALTPATSAVIVNSPSNPTGAVLGTDDMAALVGWAEGHDLWVISDEVYDEMVFEGVAASPFNATTSGSVVSIFSMSKTYSMTGWRVGYTVADRAVSPLIEKSLEPTISCANAPAQRAAIAALAGDQSCVAAMRDAYRARRDVVMAILDAAAVPHLKPRGAFYLWIDISGSGLDSTTFASELLDEEQVALTPGIAFGDFCDDHVRISLASPPELLVDGVERLVAKLQRST